VLGVGRGKHLVAFFNFLLCASEVHIGWSQHADAGVMVLVVVPVEELGAEAACVLDATKTLWEGGPVLQCLELGLREWVVVRDMRPGMRLGDAQIRQQAGNQFGRHRRAAVCVESKLALVDALTMTCLFNEGAGQRRILPVGNRPAHNVAAENIHDDVQVEIRPLRRAMEFRNVPTPKLVGLLGQQLWSRIFGVSKLVSPLLRLVM